MLNIVMWLQISLNLMSNRQMASNIQLTPIPHKPDTQFPSTFSAPHNPLSPCSKNCPPTSPNNQQSP